MVVPKNSPSFRGSYARYGIPTEIDEVSVSHTPGADAFGERHSSQEIWKLVLWMRRLANLTPDERKEIERETSEQERIHEEVMRQVTPRHDFDETH